MRLKDATVAALTQQAATASASVRHGQRWARTTCSCASHGVMVDQREGGRCGWATAPVELTRRLRLVRRRCCRRERGAADGELSIAAAAEAAAAAATPAAAPAAAATAAAAADGAAAAVAVCVRLRFMATGSQQRAALPRAGGRTNSRSTCRSRHGAPASTVNSGDISGACLVRAAGAWMMRDDGARQREALGPAVDG